MSFSQSLCNRLESWIPAPAWGSGPVGVFGCMREGKTGVQEVPEGEKSESVCVYALHVSKPPCVCVHPLWGPWGFY